MTDRTVVVGGGITGLSAAHQLATDGREFLLLEATDRIGGKIHSGSIEGASLPFPVDSAADGFLVRQPEVVDLCHELGLGADLVAPSSSGAFIWANAALHPILTPSVLGVPLNPEVVKECGWISQEGVDDFANRFAKDHAPLINDATVGEVVRPRVGDEVYERLVDPLLGGISAGNADDLSIETGAAQLAAAAQSGGRFSEALQAQLTAGNGATGPVFNGLRGGTRRLVEALGDRLGDNICANAPVHTLERDGARWRVGFAGGTVTADAVILATPAWATADLIAPHCEPAARTLRDLVYSDAVLTTFVIDRAEIDHPLNGSGFLVPRNEGLIMTACSWTSSKWAHYHDGTHAILRVSAGRTNDTRWTHLSEANLVAQLSAELSLTVGLRGEPAVRVTPWRQSLPQYRPGHLTRCGEIETALATDAAGLVVTGAQMRGLGLPACVRQGRTAALTSSTRPPGTVRPATDCACRTVRMW